MKLPLSLFQLTHKKLRLAVALTGIAFADILMFMQVGFQDALFDSSVVLHKSIDGDIFILNSKTGMFTAARSFSSRRLYEILGVDQVESVTPMYVGIAPWKNREKRTTRNIFIVGLNPNKNVINLPDVSENISLVKQQDVILFDRLSRSEYGPISELFEANQSVVAEVANRRTKVKGLFSLGTSFGADGTIITSDVNFRRIFPQRSPGLIDVGVIQLKPQGNVEETLKFLRSNFSSEDITFFSKEEFINKEINFWKNRTAIGFIFSVGFIMGFIVGTVIVYQILYTDVADHLPEYATLKAMGYTDVYLFNVVFQQAIILGCIGFVPGLSLSMLLYSFAAQATGLPLIMTMTKAIMILILTIIMCCISGAISVNQLRAADPADIF